MVTITVRGSLSLKHEELLEKAANYNENYTYLCDLFCEMGYGQGHATGKRAGYLELFDWLQRNGTEENIRKKASGKRLKLIEATPFMKLKQFGKIATSPKGLHYPSQHWHFLISYTAWNKALNRKCGSALACAELLLYLYELEKDTQAIEKIINSVISDVRDRKEFIDVYNKLNEETRTFSLTLGMESCLIEVKEKGYISQK